MISKRQSYILRYWNKSCRSEPTTTVRSAIANSLINCLSGDECLQLVIDPDAEFDRRLRERLQGRLLGAVSNEPAKLSDRVLKRLLHALATTPYPQKATFAHLLERLYWSVSPQKRRSILTTFLYSPQRAMRRRAYKIMREDWSLSLKSHLLYCWEQWHEAECALMIVEHFEPEFLVKHIDQLSVDLNAGNYISRLFLRACPHEPSLLMKLKRMDGITYAYVAARLGKNIPKKSALHLLRKYKYDSRLPILVWSLGQFGYWDLLTEIADKIDLLEKQRRRHQFENYGMDSALIDKLLGDNITELPPTPTPTAAPS